jgi:hypothetical protein
VAKGQLFGSFGEGRAREVLLEGVLSAGSRIQPVLINSEDCIYSVYRQKKVFSNLNFQRTIAILHKMFGKATKAISADLAL